MNRFTLLWKNLLRSKRRSTLTALSSAVLVLLLAVLLAMYEALNAPPVGEGPARRLFVQHATSLAYRIPETHQAKIQEISGVKTVNMMSWFQGQYGTDPKDPNNWFGRLATDVSSFFETMVEIRIPEEQKRAFVDDRQGAIAGKRLAEKFGWKLGDKIVFRGDIYPCDAELYLRGIFTSVGDIRAEDNLWFQHKYLDELLGRPGKTGTFSVLCESTGVVSRVATEIDAKLANTDAPTRTMTEKEFSLSFIEMIGNIKLILFSISFAILFVMALVTANTIAMGTRERVSEAAVMKTLGFLRSQILSLVLFEALAISTIGGLLGLVFARGFVGVIDQIGFIPGIAMTPSVIAFSFGGCLFVGLLAAGVPAAQLASVRIVDGLRKVG